MFNRPSRPGTRRSIAITNSSAIEARPKVSSSDPASSTPDLPSPIPDFPSPAPQRIIGNLQISFGRKSVAMSDINVAPSVKWAYCLD